MKTAEMTPEIRAENVEFLNLLRQYFGINLIYYPGCGDDFVSLEKTFKPNQIVYIDKDPNVIKTARKRKRKTILIATAAEPCFREGVFDATFIQDIHAGSDGTEAIMKGVVKTLKPGGILIYSAFDCGGDGIGVGSRITLEHVRAFPDLEEVALPFRIKYYAIFQKK